MQQAREGQGQTHKDKQRHTLTTKVREDTGAVRLRPRSSVKVLATANTQMS